MVLTRFTNATANWAAEHEAAPVDAVGDDAADRRDDEHRQCDGEHDGGEGPRVPVRSYTR